MRKFAGMLTGVAAAFIMAGSAQAQDLSKTAKVYSFEIRPAVGVVVPLTDDLDTGWSRLSPRMQAEVGRSSFDGFWSTVSSVRTSGLSTSAGGSSVDVTLRYTMDDGRVSVERHRIDLVRDGGQYLIDDDTPVG